MSGELKSKLDDGKNKPYKLSLSPEPGKSAVRTESISNSLMFEDSWRMVGVPENST